MLAFIIYTWLLLLTFKNDKHFFLLSVFIYFHVALLTVDINCEKYRTYILTIREKGSPWVRWQYKAIYIVRLNITIL